MSVLDITPTPQQQAYLESKERFPLFIGGVGCGKTFFLLLKIYLYCQAYPNSLAMIIRKEYTDLKDSTINDFERYFGVKINSHREYELKNGSKIMFRHGDDINVLKNITLDIAGIEQAEEFEDSTTFEYLRERMRGSHGAYQQICLIANANGHNWLWKHWINNPIGIDYKCIQMTTFENEANLPPAFVADMRSRAITSPNNYRRMCLNSHEEISTDDMLLDYDSIQQAIDIILYDTGYPKRRAMGVDVARFGGDETVFVIIESVGLKWRMIDCVRVKHDKNIVDSNNGMETVSRIIELRRKHNVSIVGIDDDGIGGIVRDRVKELNIPVVRFQNGTTAKRNDLYGNTRTENMFLLKELIEQGDLKLLNNDKLKDELMTIKYKFKGSSGCKILTSKDELRREGIASPNIVDALMIAVAVRTKASDYASNGLQDKIKRLNNARLEYRGVC